MYCVYPNCTSTRKKNPELSLHGFPKDADKLQQWMEAINMDELPEPRNKKGHGICSLHFNQDLIRSSNNVKKHLSPDAVPYKVSA